MKKTTPVARYQPKPKQGWFEHYSDAFKHSFLRAWRWKFLWFWAFFLPSGIGFNYSFHNFNIAEDSSSSENSFLNNDFLSTWQNYWVTILIAIAVGFLLLLFFWWLSAVARSGVIKALNQIQQQGKPTTFNFKRVWQQGKISSLKILSLDLIIGIIVLLSILILLIPAILLAIQLKQNLAWFVPLFFYALFAIFFFIVWVISLSYLQKVTLFILVLQKKKLSWSIKKSYQLLRLNLKEALKAWLFRFFMGLASGLAVFTLIITMFTLGALFISPFIISSLSSGSFSPLTVGASIIGAVLLLVTLATLLVFKIIVSLWSLDFWLWWTKKITVRRKQ